MSSRPPAVAVENEDGGDSSRESGIGDPQTEVEEVPEEVEPSNASSAEVVDEDVVGGGDEGCAPSLGFGTGDKSGDAEEGAFSWASSVGGDPDGVNGKDKDDVKKLTSFDAATSQQRRRKETLEWQRQRRDEILDKIRQLEDSAYSDSETEDEMDFAESVRRTTGAKPQVQTLEEIFEESGGSVPAAELMEVAVPKKNKSKHARAKRRNKQNQNWTEENGSSVETTATSVQSSANSNYRHHQYYPPHYSRRPRFRQTPCRPMLSEWMLEKPEDFEEGWLGVICPVGKRVIVMASRGKTKIFSRKDEYLGAYKSLLPGGCRYNYRDSTTNRNRGVTILDCIWSQQTQTFYVLDMLCWNSHSCVNCDTDYRQFFLTSKFSENMELLERSPSNPFPFRPLPYFPAGEMPLVMWSTVQFPENVDGLLFFHKEAFYISETNPLCLWIVLTQIESILEISVSPELLSRQVKVKNLSSLKKQQRLAKKPSDGQSQEMEVALG